MIRKATAPCVGQAFQRAKVQYAPRLQANERQPLTAFGRERPSKSGRQLMSASTSAERPWGGLSSLPKKTRYHFRPNEKKQKWQTGILAPRARGRFFKSSPIVLSYRTSVCWPRLGAGVDGDVGVASAKEFEMRGSQLVRILKRRSLLLSILTVLPIVAVILRADRLRQASSRRSGKEQGGSEVRRSLVRDGGWWGVRL